MCGIIGYTGRNNAVPYLLKGLHSLEYRGYDSAGIALFSEGEIGFCKCKGRVSTLEKIVEKKEVYSTTGIGHTRWATHGEPSVVNAHPHLSEIKKFAVVHNGIIENYEKIKSDLIKKGYSFKSDTVTEVIPNLIDSVYQGDIIKALLECAGVLQGSFAIAVMSEHCPDSIVCIRRNNPLVLCKGADGMHLSSDVTALLCYSDTVYKPEENSPVVITSDKIEFYNSEGELTKCKEEKINWVAQQTEKNGYEHYMLKEIMQQPEAVRDTLEAVSKDAGCISDILKDISKIHIIACGSAYHVGLTGKYVIEKLSVIQCECHIASEFRYSDVPMGEGHLCIIISQSGETADSLAALRKAKQKGAYTLGNVNVKGSSIASESDRVIYTKAGPEIAVATTKAYSAQLSVIYFIAALLCENDEKREKLMNELFSLPSLIEGVLHSCDEECRTISSLFDKRQSAYFIGRNTDYPSAMEGALKMKEISYIHCEAYAAGELKHGTISLIEKGTVVVAVMTNSAVFSKTYSNVKEVQSRGAKVVFIVKKSDAHLLTEESNVIVLDDCDDIFSGSLSAIPLQLLSYYTAKAKGCDIDKPRNLAKSVTVE